MDKFESALNNISKLKIVAEAITVSYEESDKLGYDWRITKLGDITISKEYIKKEEETENDGTDYTKPINYEIGMSVVENLWYTDGENVWLAIKSGMPESFEDKEYFDIIEV